MFYTIYKITNRINNKIYIGKHKTKELNDNYMGSGKLLKFAIKKYGLENFTKEILYVFDNEEDMNTKEKQLVNESFTNSDETYNLCIGGKGGFSYINENGLGFGGSPSDAGKEGRRKADRTLKEKYGSNFRSIVGKKNSHIGTENLRKFRENNLPPFLGKKHTEETKQKMRKPKNQGSKNSQFGTVWITNGNENKKIKKIDTIPEGWYKGRKILFS